jgi:dihydrofolate reductase
MEIILIAAMATNRIIGNDNRMPWYIPEELAFFKRTTMGYPLIMGRKTFATFNAPLPGRRHIVLSRNQSYQPKGAEAAESLEQAIVMCQGSEKAFVIGGAQIFALAIPLATTIMLTTIHREFPGDVVFPVFSEEEFALTDSVEYPTAKIPFTVNTYHRQKEHTF